MLIDITSDGMGGGLVFYDLMGYMDHGRELSGVFWARYSSWCWDRTGWMDGLID